MIGTDCLGSWKSNYHTITTTTAPVFVEFSLHYCFISNEFAIISDDFPEDMKECLQTDYKGRFYEDFYRYEVEVNVVISNSR